MPASTPAVALSGACKGVVLENAESPSNGTGTFFSSAGSSASPLKDRPGSAERRSGSPAVPLARLPGPIRLDDPFAIHLRVLWSLRAGGGQRGSRRFHRTTSAPAASTGTPSIHPLADRTIPAPVIQMKCGTRVFIAGASRPPGGSSCSIARTNPVGVTPSQSAWSGPPRQLGLRP